MHPLLVLVSGAPGSGKTTLARNVAEQMRLPHVERDKFLYGMERTAGAKLERAASIPVYYRHVAAMLKDGVSLVTDGTLYKNISERDIKSHFMSNAVVVNVHARAKDPHGRFYDREMKRKGESNDWVGPYMEHLKIIYADTAEPLDLGAKVLHVATDDDYSPNIKEVITEISDYYNTLRGTQ